MAELSTYSDIVTLVYSLIQDSATSRRLATTDQIDIWANSRLSEMAEHAEYIDEVATDAGDLTGTTTYTITGTGGLMSLWRVEIDDEYIDPTTTRELYQSSRTWQAQTGKPRWYYLDSMNIDDDIRFGLWPTPSADYDLRAIYTTAADTLDYVSLTDKVMLPIWALSGLVWGILASFYRSESRMQNDATADFYEIMYNDTVTRLRARSYARLNRSKAWGEGRGRKTSGDLRQLLPSSGFPYP